MTKISPRAQALTTERMATSNARGMVPVALAGAAVFGAFLGFSRLSYGLLLPAIHGDLSGSYAAFGDVGSANLAGYLAGTLALPLLLLRVADRRRLNLVSLLVMNIALGAAATSTDLLQLGVWRFLTGFASGPAAVLTLALVLGRVPPERRGMVSGLIWAGGAVGMVLSALVGPLLAAAPHLHAWRLVWVCMAVLGLAASAALHLALREPAPSTPARPPATGPAGARLSLLRPPLLWLAGAYAMFGAGYIVYFTFVVALLVRQGVPPAAASFAWALLGIAGAVGGIAWGRSVDGAAQRFALAGALASGALGGLAVLTRSLPIELAGAVIIGSASFGVPSIVTALVRRAIADERSYTATFSLLTAAVGVGQVAGPVAAGLVIDAGGLIAGTALSGVVLLVGAMLAAGYGLGAERR